MLIQWMEASAVHSADIIIVARMSGLWDTDTLAAHVHHGSIFPAGAGHHLISHPQGIYRYYKTSKKRRWHHVLGRLHDLQLLSTPTVGPIFET